MRTSFIATYPNGSDAVPGMTKNMTIASPSLICEVLSISAAPSRRPEQTKRHVSQGARRAPAVLYFHLSSCSPLEESVRSAWQRYSLHA